MKRDKIPPQGFLNEWVQCEAKALERAEFVTSEAIKNFELRFQRGEVQPWPTDEEIEKCNEDSPGPDNQSKTE